MDVSRYRDMLLSLPLQLNRLQRYNREYWGGWLSDHELAAVDILGNHVQQVNNLEILHVSSRSPREDVERWWKVLAGEHPDAYWWHGFRMDSEHLRVWGSNVRQYEPGIHRIRINLVAHWEPKNSRSIEEVRQWAKSTGEIFAHSEVLSAYGLHSELLREQDGENLPYADMAGFAMVPNESVQQYCPYLDWGRLGCMPGLDAHVVDYRNAEYAAPRIGVMPSGDRH